MFTTMMLILYTILMIPVTFITVPSIVSPRKWWWSTQAKKYQSPEANEPSSLAYQHIQINSALGLGALMLLLLLLIYLQVQEQQKNEFQKQQLLKGELFDKDMKDPQKSQQILRFMKQTGRIPDRYNVK